MNLCRLNFQPMGVHRTDRNRQTQLQGVGLELPLGEAAGFERGPDTSMLINVQVA